MSEYSDWIGKTETNNDVLTKAVVDAIHATLDTANFFKGRADKIPLAAHWCVNKPNAPMSMIGADGHPKKGGFLPPIELPRRMWAGGKLNFHGGFNIGDTISRQSIITNVQLKQGSSGKLYFVTINHKISNQSGLVIDEFQDIVYREADKPNAEPPPIIANPEPDLDKDVSIKLYADPVLLFRFSAITFNAHRIHYDRDYAINEENYRGLVVHGPLQATLLLEFIAQITNNVPKYFEFRGVRPLIDGNDFTLNMKKQDDEYILWTEDYLGYKNMTALARF